jgi:hypothetical protein
MEDRQSGIFRLFIIATFFCISIFFLNNNKKNSVTATHIDICSIKADPAIHFSLDRLYAEISSLFLSGNIDLIAKTIAHLKAVYALEIVKKMMQDDAIELSYDDKVHIVYGVIVHGCPQKKVQYDFLDILYEDSFLSYQTPLLLVLARSKYADIIPLFIAWGKDRQKLWQQRGLLTECAEAAFERAVEENDDNAVEMLFCKKVRISSVKASDILWHIVENQKKSTLIPLFINHAQANVNYTYDNKTLLVAAIERNNIDLVRVLLDKGAVVDRIIDMQENTALTIAMKNRYHAIEQLLREYGA